MTRPTEVAAEHHASSSVGGHGHAGGAQDVAGRIEAGSEGVRDVMVVTECHRLKQRANGNGFFFVEQRDRRVVA